MLYNLLSSEGKTRMVEIPEAALYALLGFLTVFVGIVLLIFVVWLVGKVMVSLKGQARNEKVNKAKPAAPNTQSAPVVVEDADEETVAVIMATLMAYYQVNYPKYEFTVKRIKRI